MLAAVPPGRRAAGRGHGLVLLLAQRAIPGGSMRVHFVAVLLVVFCVLTGPVKGAESDAKPFPLRTTILRDNDATYYVEGTQRIPKGVEISCQQGIKIIGRGSDAVLEVEGSLQVHGVNTRKVVFENVTISTPQEFEDVHIDHCVFRGTGGLIVPEDSPVDGKFFVEHTRFHRGTRLEVTMTRGHIDVGSVYSSDPAVIRAVVPEGKTENNVRVIVRDCSAEGGGALWGGLVIEVIEGAKDANVRRNLLGGDEARFDDCKKLTFDSNLVTAAALIFRQSSRGHIAKTKISKCDIKSTRLEAYCPQEKGSKEKLFIDNCWFRGETKKSVIHEQIINDATDVEGNSVHVIVKRPSAKPIGLAGAVER